MGCFCETCVEKLGVFMKDPVDIRKGKRDHGSQEGMACSADTWCVAAFRVRSSKKWRVRTDRSSDEYNTRFEIRLLSQ